MASDNDATPVVIVQPTNPSPVAQPVSAQSPAAIPAPNVPAAMPNVPTTAPTVGTPTPDDTQLNPANWPKETFREGVSRANPSYTDVNGNIIANVPAVRRTGKGVLGQILMGALEGAARGMTAQAPEGARGYGAAASAGAKAAEEGRIAADNRARAIAQLNFENQQKAIQAKLEHNLVLAQTRDLLQKSQHEEEEFPTVMKNLGLETQEHQITIQNALDERRQVHADLIASLEAHGVHPYASITQNPQNGKSLAGQAMSHVPAMVSGKALPVQNGKVGKENGAVLFSTEDLDKPVEGDPIQVPYYDGTKDNNGNLIPHYRLIQPDGKITYGDVARQFMAADKQLDMYQKKDAAQMALQTQKVSQKETQARADLQEAQANLANEQAQQMKVLGAEAPPQNYQPSPNVMSLSPKELGQSLTQQGVKVPVDFQALYAIGHYDADIKSLAQKQYRGVPGRSQEAAIEYIRTYINPSWTQTNYQAVQKLQDSFANPQLPAAGGQMVAFNTGTRHLGQLYDASQALSNGNIQVLNNIANSMGIQVGKTPVLTFNSIRQALVGELGKTFKGSSVTDQEAEGIENTISSAQSPTQTAQVARTYAHLMLSKTSALTQDYIAYTGHLPPNAIDPTTMRIYQDMGIDPSTAFPEGALVSVGGTANPKPNQPPPPPVQPKLGDIKKFPNGAYGKWDGKGYVAIPAPQGQ